MPTKLRWLLAMGHSYQYHVFAFSDPLDYLDRLNDRLSLYVNDGWEPLSVTHAPGLYPTGCLLVLMRREREKTP